jgi:hypothetical protein
MKSSLILATMMVIPLVAVVVAQEMPKQEPAIKARPARYGQSEDKTRNEAASKSSQESAPEMDAAALSRAISALSDQVRLLVAEVRRLRRYNEHNSQMLELLICEQRLNWLEDKIASLEEHKSQLAAREREIQYRSRNIQQEAMMRGLLRREEAEAAIRTDLQRALDDVHNQQAFVQQQLTNAEMEAGRLRQRITTLRKKLELSEEADENDRSSNHQQPNQ